MTPQHNYKPTPTEYRGVRFRSKSEAILAALFDVSGVADWIYEPHFLEVNGYVPDFALPLVVDHADLFLSVVEYKPSEVTETYREVLASRNREMRKLIGLECDFWLVTGSMFEGMPMAWHFSDEKWTKVGNLQQSWIPGVEMWFGCDAIEFARTTRFDLASK